MTRLWRRPSRRCRCYAPARPRSHPSFVRTWGTAWTRWARSKATSARSAAVGALSEAATIRRELARRLASAHEPDLAKTLSQLGRAQCEAAAVAESVETVTEAVAIQRRLVLEDEGSFLPDLAISLTNLGVSQLAAGSPADALAAVTEAVALHRRARGGSSRSVPMGSGEEPLPPRHDSRRRRSAPRGAGHRERGGEIYAPLAERFPIAFSKPLQDAHAVARTAREHLGLPAANLV